MIIDVHTHTPTHQDAVPADERKVFTGWHSGGPVSTTNSWHDYQTGMEGTDISIVFNIHVPDVEKYVGISGDAARINDATAEFVAGDNSRIGFMSVDPNLPDYLDEYDRAKSLGLKGIKLGANYQRFDPLGKEALELYRRADRDGLPILFHVGASPIALAPLKNAHPLTIDEIAIAFPNLKIVMAHIGHPWVRETVAVIRKHPNVYSDVSAIYTRPWMTYEALLMAFEWGAMHKLLFGSDFPITTPKYAMERLRAVNEVVAGTSMPKIPAEKIEAIIHADALSALSLTDPRG